MGRQSEGILGDGSWELTLVCFFNNSIDHVYSLINSPWAKQKLDTFICNQIPYVLNPVTKY